MKIVVTGPESSGKTTLALSLSKQLGFGYVTEMARPFLNLVGGIYDQDSLYEIALLQKHEEQYQQSLHPHTISDTDLLTIIIWSEQKYGSADPIWYKWWMEQPAELIFLCRPDIPWKPDPLRENPTDRDSLFDVYVEKLQEFNKHFYIIEGTEDRRLQDALTYIDQLIAASSVSATKYQ